MKYVLPSLPLFFVASASFAHEAAYPHHQMPDLNWMPLSAGLLVIGFAASLGWSRK